MLLSLLLALWFQTTTSLDTPGIVLVLSSDTAFVTPTESIGREGVIRAATLVQIYPLRSESWETVRLDSDLEIDCEARRFRMVARRSLDAEGRIRSSEGEPAEWEPLPDGYPPLTLLHALTCGDTDLSVVDLDSLEAELPRLRAQLQ